MSRGAQEGFRALSKGGFRRERHPDTLTLREKKPLAKINCVLDPWWPLGYDLRLLGQTCTLVSQLLLWSLVPFALSLSPHTAFRYIQARIHECLLRSPNSREDRKTVSSAGLTAPIFPLHPEWLLSPLVLTCYTASHEFLLKDTPFCLPKPGPWKSGWVSKDCRSTNSSLLPQPPR